MAIEHINRRGDTYYLHEGKTKTGKPKYFFSRKRDGILATAIPAGFEVYEDPESRVTLRKILPRVVTDEEVSTVERGVRNLAKQPHFVIDVKGHSIVVHLADNSADAIQDVLFSRLGIQPNSFHLQALQRFTRYSPMMRFTLVDEENRHFSVDRWCFKGSIDDWLPLMDFGDLKSLVAKYCPHLGRESFYELF